MDNCLFTNFYKNCYKDIANFSDSEVKKHWETIGKKEGRLPNKILFDEKYPGFNVKEWAKNNTKYLFSTKYEIYGWVYMENKKNYKKYLIKNNFIIDKVSNINKEPVQESIEKHVIEPNMNLVINEIFNNKFDTETKTEKKTEKKIESSKIINIFDSNIELEELITKYNITKLNVSKALEHFESRYLSKYNLEKYYPETDLKSTVIFFGLYDQYDFKKVAEHDGIKFLMWGGTDCDDRYKIRKNSIFVIKKISGLNHISISKTIKERLFKYDIASQLVNFSLVDKNLFRPVKKLGESIYIYNGFTKGNEYIYGEKIYKEIVEKLPNFNYIYSNQLNLSWEKMPDVYENCFIGLRLTNGDGNANTVQEFNSMGIPIIFNGDGGIPWINSEDIVENINKYYNEKPN